MKKRSNRLSLMVAHDMMVALEIQAGKTGLPVATQAMVVLRQGLSQTINSDAAQLRIRQDQAFRTRDQWLQDVSTETYVANAMKAAAGEANDEPPS